MIPYSDADVRQQSTPIVNALLIGINCLVFLFELQMGGLGLLRGATGLDVNVFFLKWGFIPQELTSGQPYTRLAVGFAALDIESPIPTVATIFSSMFIHGGLMHFASNMMFLWVFGNNIEDRLGHLKYLLFYLLTGVIATFSHLAIDPHSQTPLVGASGAISGVLGAYILMYPYNHIKALVIFLFITVVQVQAVYFLGFWFLLQVLNALGALGLSEQVNVAFLAHIGGFLGGGVIMGAYKLATGQPLWPSRHRPPWDYWHRTGR